MSAVLRRSPNLRYGAVGLPGIGVGWPLGVLILWVGQTRGLGRRWAVFRGVPNGSMVPCQVHGGTILLPVCPVCATCHSHYCECLYCVGGPSAGWASECAGLQIGRAH